MGIVYSPSIVTRNLLLNLDFGNIQKCYNGSENLLTYSNINVSNWSTNLSPTLTENSAASPDGTTNATQIATTAAIGSGVFRSISLTSGNTYTYSLFVKSVSGSNTIYFGSDGGTSAAVQVNTSTGVASTYFGSPTNITSIVYPNGWYRISFTFTASATNHSFVIYNLTANSNTWLVYGAQVEKGRVASPYVQTVASTVTRPTTATSTISNYSHTINRPEYISYDATNNSIRFDRNETFANFTGSITSNVLTVTAMSGVTTITNGSALSYSGLTPTRTITSFGTGIGTTGTYNVSAGIDTTSRAMTAAYKIGGNMVVSASGSLASNTYLYNDHTTEVWARINDINPANYDVYEQWNVLAVYSGYHSMFIYTPSIGLQYYIWDNTGPTAKTTTALTVGTSGTDVIQGQWFHVALTKSGSTFKTYLNGTLRKTDTITSTALAGVTNNLRLGAAGDENTGSFYYYGKNDISCMKMYNTTLTDNEISQNFNALRGRFGL